jgi:hypothetical protein
MLATGRGFNPKPIAMKITNGQTVKLKVKLSDGVHDVQAQYWIQALVIDTDGSSGALLMYMNPISGVFERKTYLMQNIYGLDA